MSNLFPGFNTSSKHIKSVENTEDDKTLAEDDESDQHSGSNSGSMDRRFERITVNLARVNGKKFGLGVILVNQRILVCKIDTDSIVAGKLKIGDQILQVNSKSVTDKLECRKRLVHFLKEDGTVAVLILRPKTSDALTMIEQEIQRSHKPGVEKMNSQTKL